MSELNGDFLSVPTEARISFYMHQKAGKLGLPLSGNFELTSRCNFNCKMCYIHSIGASADGELSADEWLEIGKQAAENGMLFLLLTGGEPLLRSDFAEIYSGLKKLGLVISVNTNGSFLCGDILELFKKDPPSRLNVSIYGASNKTYEDLCGNKSFSKVSENIEAAVENGLSVKLNYSITPSNHADADEIFAFAKRLGLYVQSSSYMYPQLRTGNAGFGENGGRFTPKQAAYHRVLAEKKYIGKEAFLQRAERLGRSVSEDLQNLKKDRRMHCRAGRSNFWVDKTGNMGMCGMIPADDNKILQNGFLSCWEKVKNQAGSVRLPLKCASCKYGAVCNVCAAVCLCETGSYDCAPEYVCEYSEKSFEYILKTKETDCELL